MSTSEQGKTADVGGVAADQLKSIVERIERLEDEKRGLAEDIKEIYAEARGAGFDTKTLRTVVKLRRLAKHERDEQQELLDLYTAALGL